MTSAKIRRIASLLDDPDEAVAVAAIAELLANGKRLGDLPGILQESSDPLVRRRAHQLQAALTLRNRRKNFLARISDPELSIPEKLTELHLLWFDNDNPVQILDSVVSFIGEAENIRTLTDLACFMKQQNLSAEKDSTMHPEDYCIGTVLSEKTGAASLLTLLAAAAGSGIREELFFCQMENDFFLCSGSSVLAPSENWAVLTPDRRFEKASRPDQFQMLKFAASMLFSCAITSDSFRYVYTIAQSLSGTDDDSIMDFFPYPFYPE